MKIQEKQKNSIHTNSNINTINKRRGFSNSEEKSYFQLNSGFKQKKNETSHIQSNFKKYYRTQNNNTNTIQSDLNYLSFLVQENIQLKRQNTEKSYLIDALKQQMTTQNQIKQNQVRQEKHPYIKLGKKIFDNKNKNNNQFNSMQFTFSNSDSNRNKLNKLPQEFQIAQNNKHQQFIIN